MERFPLLFFYTVVGCIVLAVLVAALYLPYAAIKQTIWEAVHARRIRQIQASRSGESRDQFVRELIRVGVPERIARVAHGFLAYTVAQSPDFSARPADSLAEVFGIGRPGGMPMKEALREYAARCGLALAPDELESLKPVTVQDMTLLVTSLSHDRAQNRAARTLLRPSAPPVENLLRPTQGPGETDPQMLLRPNNSDTTENIE